MIAAIYDLVGSRRLGDRRRVYSAVGDALERVWVRHREALPARPSRVLGDSVELLALDWEPVAELSHLLLLGGVEFYLGLGVGEAEVLGVYAHEADGPALWSAREALEEAKGGRRLGARVVVRVGAGAERWEAYAARLAALYVLYVSAMSREALLYSYMYVWEGLGVKEIAGRVSRSRGTVSRVLSRSGAYTLRKLIEFTGKQETL